MLYQMEVSARSRRAIWFFFLVSVLFVVMPPSTSATGSVTLAWNPSTNPIVTGYNVYYGGKSGTYTNKICAGKATNATVSALTQGVTYYFAATTFTSSGTESPLSCEVSCQISLNGPVMTCSNTFVTVVCTNLCRFRTNTLPSGVKIVTPLPALRTNTVFAGFWIYYPPSGTWTLQSSSNLVTWSDCATGTNAVFIPNIGGKWYFRFSAS